MPKTNKYDFGGYATKNGLKCTDGRVILKDAFKDNDGMTVPLVWQHMHDSPENVIGHAVLENREDGVYAHCRFNDTPNGQKAKIIVEHGDVAALSIWANSLVEKSKAVIHGIIREVSLVLSGANPGALIDNVSISHADGTISQVDDEAIIYTGLELDHEEEVEHADGPDDSASDDNAANEETIEEVFNSLSEKQKVAVYAIIGAAAVKPEEEDDTAEHSNISKGDRKIMKRNVFDGTSSEKEKKVISHELFSEILSDAVKLGSLRQSFIAHSITNIDYLFPDAQAVDAEPSLISRDMEWVAGVINGARHSRFSRIKSIHADITVETARALGYVTAALKKEEVFGLLHRTTTPTTIYKKQKLDRDDLVDITDLDVVAWLKREMRIMLDEEIARAMLVSDGRDPVAQADDKIPEANIRPIWKDDDMYSHKVQTLVGDGIDDVLDKYILGRANYKGSGSPTLYAAPTFLTNVLLMKDTLGYRIYKTEAELAAALRVSKIVEVPVMENLVREAGATDYKLLGIVVNMKDYVLGADKGGEVNFFDDFDIDYNQYKYLIETRVSGALVLPKSALVLEQATT